MAIDRKRIIDAMSKVTVESNSDGIIPAFNVYVNRLPSFFWNSFSERLTRRVGAEMLEAAEFLLVDAARTCGYHTGYGIITSDEWKAVVEPMIDKRPDDILYGAFAVFTAWGCAKSEIVELVPAQRMVVRAYDYYESDVVSYGASKKPSAYMVRGVAAAFMALAYGGEYSRTDMDRIRLFDCIQTRGIECGDEYGEFIVTRSE